MTESIGTVVRLQVQASRLKPGPRGARVYDPTPLVEVEALEVGPRGCVGLVGGRRVLDVHHADHPDTRNRDLVNGLSLLPRSHLNALHARYGGHVRPGESLLIDLAAAWPHGSDLLLETDGEPLLLQEVLAAPPCVEFTRYCLGLPPGSLDGVPEALQDLDGGARGFYARARGTGTVTVGAGLSAVPRNAAR